MTKFINNELESESELESNTKLESKFEIESESEQQFFYSLLPVLNRQMACLLPKLALDKSKKLSYPAKFGQVKKKIFFLLNLYMLSCFLDGCFLDGCFLHQLQQSSHGRNWMLEHFWATTSCHPHSTLASQICEGLHQL